MLDLFTTYLTAFSFPITALGVALFLGCWLHLLNRDVSWLHGKLISSMESRINIINICYHQEEMIKELEARIILQDARMNVLERKLKQHEAV